MGGGGNGPGDVAPDRTAGGCRTGARRSARPAREGARPTGSARAAATAIALILAAALAPGTIACGSEGFGRLRPPAATTDAPAPEDTGEAPPVDAAPQDPGRDPGRPVDLPLAPECPNPPPDGRSGPLRVLFLGNSYTGQNDLPGTFRTLAGHGGRAVQAERQVHDGWTLGAEPDDFATDDAALAALAKGWDVVVLQEQSLMPAYRDALAGFTIPGARTLATEARMSNACVRVVMLQTWGRRDGYPPDFQDFDAMQDALTAGYAAVAAAVQGEVAPAGEAWRTVRRQDPGIDLHAGDGSHPAPAGTYLAACALYGRLFLEPSRGLPAPAGLPSPPLLQQAADDAQSW